MHNRLRLLQGATALLYLGPLLAGLGGFGWRVVPVFVLIFLTWTLVLRPASWPATRADWQRPAAVVALMAQSAVQVLLVTLCFGIGRGIGGALGLVPPFPVVLPIAISFLAIPLCRLIWDPRRAEAMDRFLDTAIADITQAAAGGVPHDRSDARTVTARLLAPLQALPDEATEADLARHLRAITAHADPEDVAHLLSMAAQSGTASRAGLRALILTATDPRLTDALAGRGYGAQAFRLTGGDPELAMLYARRAAAQLHDDAAAWSDSPSPDTLRNAAAGLDPATAAALIALADLTEACAPPGDDPA